LPVVAVKSSSDIEKAAAVCEALKIAEIGCQGYDADDRMVEDAVGVMIGQKPSTRP
jgi:hypothetical protein